MLILSSVGAITVLASRSQNKQNTLPPKKHAGIIKIGFVLERNCFAKCGTAIPTKEIGPANATIHAERILERSTIGAKVAIFGIGGVGGYVVEALARSGVGSFVIVDDDKVCLTNINRQIIATRKTIGKYKVEVMRDRILEINPDAKVEMRQCFYLPENAHEFDFSEYSYVVDAVDTVTAKIEIIMRAQAAGVPVISCMGAGNKLDPTQFHVADIYKTTMCPLAKVMRHELKKRGVKKLKVVYSTESQCVHWKI